MSRIDDLIAEHCPDGVEYKTLGSIGRLFGGLSGKTKADFANGNARYVSYRNVYNNPLVDQAADDLVSISSAERQTKLQLNDVLFTASSENSADAGMSSVVAEEPEEPLYLNSFCFGLRFTDSNFLIPQFSRHLFRSPKIRSQIVRTGSGVTRFNISKQRFAAVRVPVPPLRVQEEIARTLDTFSALEVELEAELEARRRQYGYYRNTLMQFGDDVDRVPMGELGEVYRGRRFVKDDYVVDGLPAIHYGQLYTAYGTSATEVVTHVRPDLKPYLRFAQPGDVVIAEVGETVEDVGKATAWLGKTEVAIHDGCYGFRHTMNPVFIAHFFQTATFHAEKNQYVARAKVKRLSLSGIKRIRIPFPSLEEQTHIVDMLDKFDALVNDLSMGLPAELKERRKQYEYYRDKLLTFKERTA